MGIIQTVLALLRALLVGRAALAALASRVSTHRTYRPTVLRWTPSALAIRRFDQPR